MSEETPVTTTAPGVARVRWPDGLAGSEFGAALRAVNALVAEALRDHERVEVWVAPDDAFRAGPRDRR